MHWAWQLPTGFSMARSLSLLGPSVLFGKEWNTSITKSQRSRAGIPSMRFPEKLKMYWVFSLCGRWRRSAHGGSRVREQPRMRHDNTRWLNSFQAYADDNAILDPSALCVRSALVNKLYCRCVLWVGVLSWSCCSDCAACCVVVVERRVNREDDTLVVNGGDRGLQFYQTRSHAIVLHDTLPAFRIEKTVCMKTKEKLYLKVRSTPRLPRVVLKAKSHSGQQDQREQDARSSRDQPSESKSYRETWNNAVDYRIPGIPLRQWNSRIRTAKTRSRSWLKRESYPEKLVPRLSASGFPRLSTLRNECIWILSHTTQLRDSSQDPHHSCHRFLFWEIVVFRLCLVVHQPCDAETDTCLQPYNPFHF